MLHNIITKLMAIAGVAKETIENVKADIKQGAEKVEAIIRSSVNPSTLANKLDDLAAVAAQKLEWRTSIVDLLKLIDMDSSLDARKELAKELGYNVPFTGTAEQNEWLHEAVMEDLETYGINLT